MTAIPTWTDCYDWASCDIMQHSAISIGFTCSDLLSLYDIINDVCCNVAAAVESFEHTDTAYLTQDANTCRDDG